MTVVAIVAIVVGISFPAIATGIDSVRLASATDSVAAFLNSALNRADRHQAAVQITISARDGFLLMRSSEPGFERSLQLPDGIRIDKVLPEPPQPLDGPRQVLVLPGSTPPRIGILLVNRRGTRRLVRLDPITGVPRISAPEAP